MTYSEFEIETFLRTGEHEAELRREFGDALYDELADLARMIDAVPPGLESQRQKVFILPGIMGSRLSAIVDGISDLVWIDPLDLVSGGVRKLRLHGSAATIAATGTVLVPYMLMRLRLRWKGYDATFLPYDWRLSPADTGKALIDRMRAQGLSDVVLVGHSMGGLVARAMAGHDPEGDVVSRVVTIGTPNRGSYAPVEIFGLSHGLLAKIGIVDVKHAPRQIAQDVLRHFPGLLQMMPDPDARPGEAYFDTGHWPGAAVRPLKAALVAADGARTALPPPDARFRQIIGFAEETVTGAKIVDDGFVYTLTRDGDGTVPLDLAELGDVPRFYTRGTHGSLCNRRDVIAATLDLIATGGTDRLPMRPPFDTREALPAVEITAEALAARNGPARPGPAVRDTDYAAGFLTAEFDPTLMPDERTDPMVIDTKTPKGVAPGGYPLAMLRRARKRWDAARSQREQVERAGETGHPLDTETPARANAYVERLHSQIKAAPGRADPAIEIDLQEVVARRRGAADPAPEMLRREERIIGEAEEFLSVMFIKRAAQAARAVGRVVSAETGRGFGTGFLVTPGILMTNNHVLRSRDEAKASKIEFNFELEIDSREMPSHSFALRPDRLFITDERLDMTLVAVEEVNGSGTILDDFGHLPLVGVEGKILKGQPVNIIQHPKAELKQVVFRESFLKALPEDDDFVAHYTGDTQPGSSGSPVFSDRWEVVALHHSGVPETDDQGRFRTVDGSIWKKSNDPEGRTIRWIANEGIRISRIIAFLRDELVDMRARGDTGADMVEALLAVSGRAATEGVFVHDPSNCPTCRKPKTAPNGHALHGLNGHDRHTAAPRPGNGHDSDAPRRNGATVNGTDATVESATGDFDGTIITLPLRIKVDIDTSRL